MRAEVPSVESVLCSSLHNSEDQPGTSPRIGCFGSVHFASRIVLAFVCFTAALSLSPAAMADASWQTSEAFWRIMDACTLQAQKAYPDYTHEGHLQREALRWSCMRANNLPNGLPYVGAAPIPQSATGMQQEQNQPPQLQIQQLMQQMQQGTFQH